MKYRKVKVKVRVNDTGWPEYYSGYYHHSVQNDGGASFGLIEDEYGNLIKVPYSRISFIEPIGKPEKENEELKKENKDLKKQIEELKKKIENIQFDYDRGWLDADEKRRGEEE